MMSRKQRDYGASRGKKLKSIVSTMWRERKSRTEQNRVAVARSSFINIQGYLLVHVRHNKKRLIFY